MKYFAIFEKYMTQKIYENYVGILGVMGIKVASQPRADRVIPLMKKEFFLEKNFRVWSRSEVTWSWQGLENDEPLGRVNEDDFPGDKATEPLQKEKQIKNQIDPKKKKRAKIQAVTNLPPLKKICPRDLVAQGTSMTWGHHLQLGYPFSFIYCSPKNFRWSTYLALGWFASPFLNSDRSLLIYQIFLLTWIFSYLRWYPMDLSINFLLIMKTFLLLSCGCFKYMQAFWFQ